MATPLASAEELRPAVAWAPLPAEETAGVTEDDLAAYVAATVDQDGLIGHNIQTFNDLMDVGIARILTEYFHVRRIVEDLRDQTETDRRRDSIVIEISFSDVKIGVPTHVSYHLGKTKPLYPNEARLSGRTYAAPLSLAAEVVLTARYTDGREETKRAEIPPLQVAPIPVMIGSNRCHTWNLTREARKGLEEDPNEVGGYFVAKGGEWVVDWLENLKFNYLHVHKNMMANECVRGEFISQPGGAFENSSQVIIRLMKTGALTIEIISTRFRQNRFPFTLVFRLLGMTSDREVLEQIVFDPESDSPVVRQMSGVVARAIQHRDPNYAAVHNELDRERLTEFLAARLATFIRNPTGYRTNENAVQYLTTRLLEDLDRSLLPHIGRDAASRQRKLRYLGMLIHKTLLVHMDILPPSDRDSYWNKRVHGAGVSIAKAFKTQVNSSVVQPMIKGLRRELINTPFEDLTIPAIVDAARSPINTSDLHRTMEQAITSGNKMLVIRRKTVRNRVSTQALERKNYANYYSSLRSVSTHNASQASKHTERADRMRRIHPSYVGYICVARSADTGDMVGMKKELAITAGVCSAADTLPLKLQLIADPAVTPLDDVVTPDIVRRRLARIFVDGEWIGCCEKAYELVDRYRLLRREGRVVPPKTSIVWNNITDDVEFWLDVGRLTRPLLIVDNNLAEYDEAARRAAAAAAQPGGKKKAPPRVPFRQDIRLTPAHVAGLRAGTLTLEDLRTEGIVEWITPEEAENCFVAPSLGALRAAAGDVTKRYTHCDVEQAIFGLTALLSPFGNHTQPARVTYETNQARQAGGWYSFAYPFRVDKNRFFQHYTETPLVPTFANRWLYPNGMNTLVAYMISGGYNQEDSATVSAAFVQRGGFAGAFYRNEKAEREKGETFQSPDPGSTKNLKPNASYEKLVDGFVPVGTDVSKGDVLIGRVAKLTPGERRESGEGYPYKDRSVVYRLAEPATVSGVFRPRDPNDNEFGVVNLRHFRPLGVGDKMSSRAGNKSIAALLLPTSDMPYTEEGITPDIIINPHSLPSRMTIGQMLEAQLGLVCEEDGAVVDGTSFRRYDVDAVAVEMEKRGLRYNGKTRLYNGRTGEWYDAAIFVAFNFNQRLQKFAKDNEYAVGGNGPTDALTGQPLSGKSAQGGLRAAGEMENWVFAAHGAAAVATEKMSVDSDGMREYLCRNCGNQAIYNAHQGIYRCLTCGDAADITAVDSCRASIVFQHEMRSMNVKVDLGVAPYAFEVNEE